MLAPVVFVSRFAAAPHLPFAVDQVTNLNQRCRSILT